MPGCAGICRDDASSVGAGNGSISTYHFPAGAVIGGGAYLVLYQSPHYALSFSWDLDATGLETLYLCAPQV